MYSIAEHGKGKVDHVGGIVKTAIRGEIAGGKVLLDCDHMVSFLKSKFDNAKRKIYKRMDGSAKFQVIVFKPNSNSFKAGNRLCVCDECCISYDSCSLF